VTPFSMFRRLVIAGVLVTAAFASAQTRAQDVPDAIYLEALVKGSLITFNDANMTGNYEVMRLRAAKPFEDKFTAADLHEMFKGFGEQEINIATVAGMDIIEDAPSKVEDGVLTLSGHFATNPLEVSYTLNYMVEGSDWALIGIDVSAKPVQ
jgi:hypothetical protein